MTLAHAEPGAALVNVSSALARALAVLAGRKGPTVVSGRRNAVLTTATRPLPRSAALPLLAAQ